MVGRNTLQMEIYITFQCPCLLLILDVSCTVAMTGIGCVCQSTCFFSLQPLLEAAGVPAFQQHPPTCPMNGFYFLLL